MAAFEAAYAFHGRSGCVLVDRQVRRPPAQRCAVAERGGTGGRQHPGRAVRHRGLQDVEGDRGVGVPDDGLGRAERRGDGGQVDHGLGTDPGEDGVGGRRIGEIHHDLLGGRQTGQLDPVQRDHLVAVADQPGDDAGAEAPGTSGDECLHDREPPDSTGSVASVPTTPAAAASLSGRPNSAVSTARRSARLLLPATPDDDAADAVQVAGRATQRVVGRTAEQVVQQHGVAPAVTAFADRDLDLLGRLPVPLQQHPLAEGSDLVGPGGIVHRGGVDDRALLLARGAEVTALDHVELDPPLGAVERDPVALPRTEGAQRVRHGRAPGVVDDQVEAVLDGDAVVEHVQVALVAVGGLGVEVETLEQRIGGQVQAERVSRGRCRGSAGCARPARGRPRWPCRRTSVRRWRTPGSARRPATS